MGGMPCNPDIKLFVCQFYNPSVSGICKQEHRFQNPLPYRPSRKPHLPVDWRLLVEERMANVGIPLDVLWFLRFDDCLRFDFFWGFWVFANQPTVHNGALSVAVDR